MIKSNSVNIKNKAQRLLCFVLLYILCWGSLFAQQDSSLESLNRELKVAKEDTNKVNLLYKISRHYIHADVSKKLPYLDKMEKLSIKLNYSKGIGNAYAAYADHYIRLNVLDEAQFYLIKLDSLCSNGFYNEGIPVSKNLFGEYYRKKGDYENALIKYLEALSYYEKIDDKKFQSVSLQLISNLFFTMKRYKECEDYKLKGIKIKREINDKVGESTELCNLASMLISIEEYERAEIYFDLSMKLQKEIKNPLIISKIQRGLGAIYTHKGSYKKALSILENAYFTLSEITDTLEMGYTRMYQSDTYRQMKEYDSSILYLDKAINLARLGNADSVMISDFYMQYYQIYKEIGNHEKALNYFERVVKNQSDLFSTETATIISELKEKYETTQKEQKLELMREKDRVSALELEEKEAKIRERTYLFIALSGLLIAIILWMYYLRKQKELKIEKHAAQLEHKVLRAQMNPHFIFNSLSSIQHLISSNKKEAAIKYLSKFSLLMRNVLESSIEANAVLNEEILLLRKYIELEALRFDHSFSYTITLDENIDPAAIEIPTFIIQPFVENAILHGLLNKESGDKKLRIHFRKELPYLICEVEDNGVGRKIPSEKIPILEKQKISRGITVTEKRLQIIDESPETKVEIIDKIDEKGMSTGTLVVIKIRIE